MSQEIIFLIPPFLMCLILVGIHCYLGLHVLARGVIFVDLSLAQVAAFGATWALFLGFEHDGWQTYFVALTATFIAAGLFAFARRHEKNFPQEAVIGIVYALASAAVILVVDKMAHGAEHIKEALVGQVLWVQWPEVIKTALIYLAVSIVHYVFRKPLLDASLSHKAKGSFKWDFLFYALFGIVITSSVRVAGVLMVFSFLIVPAIVSGMYFKSIRSRLIFGWIFGTLLSALGLGLSFVWNLPAGALLVVLFTLCPIGLLIIDEIR